MKAAIIFYVYTVLGRQRDPQLPTLMNSKVGHRSDHHMTVQ